MAITIWKASIPNFLAWKAWVSLLLITDLILPYTHMSQYSLAYSLWTLSFFFQLEQTPKETFEDRNSQPKKPLYTLRKSINQMLLNLAVKLKCEHFRLFTGFLCQWGMAHLRNHNLFPDTRFLSRCNYVVKDLWRVRGKFDADMLTEIYISHNPRGLLSMHNITVTPRASVSRWETHYIKAI